MIRGLASSLLLGNHAPPKDQLDDETVVFNIEDSNDSMDQTSEKPPNDGNSQSSTGSRKEPRVKSDALLARVGSLAGLSDDVHLEDIFEYAWPDDDLNDEKDDKDKDFYVVQEMLADFLKVNQANLSTLPTIYLA
ncbi:unnamed protein product [Protopolystoma xenopodis]|uniref:Uncharacterized protein n=1 Tax=Protopolystoma xenopodis TaxID=117903 RepID=A0A3S5CQV7_9PLAT|nr:unnamed protein product [Protopolystoma xenopodis]